MQLWPLVLLALSLPLAQLWPRPVPRVQIDGYGRDHHSALRARCCSVSHRECRLAFGQSAHPLGSDTLCHTLELSEAQTHPRRPGLRLPLRALVHRRLLPVQAAPRQAQAAALLAQLKPRLRRAMSHDGPPPERQPPQQGVQNPARSFTSRQASGSSRRSLASSFKWER